MHSTLQAWSVYGNFSKELSALLEQPWLEVRRQVHQVADFIASWSKEAEDMEKSPVKLTLLRDLDKIRKCGLDFVYTCASDEHALHTAMHFCKTLTHKSGAYTACQI